MEEIQSCSSILRGTIHL